MHLSILPVRMINTIADTVYPTMADQGGLSDANLTQRNEGICVLSCAVCLISR